MTKIFKNIPGCECRELHCIDCDDNVSKIFFAAKLIADLRRKYCISIAYFSTHGTSKDIIGLHNLYNVHTGFLYAYDRENNNCIDLCNRISKMVNEKSVSVIIIDCIEGLDIKDSDRGVRAKRNEIKTNLYILAASCNVAIVIFCPYRKSCKYDRVFDPFIPQVLPQMEESI